MSQRLRIENDLDALSDMSDWVAQSCNALGLSSALRFRLDLAANEAVANAISYGYPPGARGAIELRLDVMDGNAVLEIEDDGVEFNPLLLAEAQRPESLEDSKIGGLGVLLIRKNIPHCEYQRQAGRNLLILKSPLNPQLNQSS